MGNLIIRKAAPADAGRLLEIYSYYVEKTAISFEYVTPSLSEFKERMCLTMKKYPYLVAEADGRIVGYCYAGAFAKRIAYARCCELSVYIDRACTGHGIGKALYDALECELKGMGILNLYACVAVPDVEDEYLTENSKHFHAHIGFTQAGFFTKCGYKFGRWYNMVWMEKLIGEHLQA